MPEGIGAAKGNQSRRKPRSESVRAIAVLAEPEHGRESAHSSTENATTMPLQVAPYFGAFQLAPAHGDKEASGLATCKAIYFFRENHAIIVPWGGAEIPELRARKARHRDIDRASSQRGMSGKACSMSKAHGGYSRSARERRRRRAAALSQRMRHGDGDAAFRLLQRGRALQGIAKRGWGWRLTMANAVRQGKHMQRLAEAAVVAERQKLEAQCAVKSAALRVRYGTGGVRGDYADGECRPVAPGGGCLACAWRWGSTEPHPVAIPET